MDAGDILMFIMIFYGEMITLGLPMITGGLLLIFVVIPWMGGQFDSCPYSRNGRRLH